MADKKEEAAKSEAGKAAPATEGGGGAKSWLPLVVVIVLMPALAFVTTQFLIIPKVVQARGGGHAGDGGQSDAPDTHAAKDSHGTKKDAKESHGAKDAHGAKDSHGAKGGKKQSYQLQKMIVNVSGTMGTRYLMTSATLVGGGSDFKTAMEDNKDQLLDIAIGALGSKTISDLEKPGARNQLRSELISTFNNALGGGVVQEIYFTEFAIQ